MPKLTDDEKDLAKRIKTLEKTRADLKYELDTIKDLADSYNEKVKKLKGKIEKIDDQINLYRQGQLILGDRV